MGGSGGSGSLIQPSCSFGRERRQLCLQAGSWRTFSRIYYSYRSVSERDLQPPVSLTSPPAPSPNPPTTPPTSPPSPSFVPFSLSLSLFGANYAGAAAAADELSFYERRRRCSSSSSISGGRPGGRSQVGGARDHWVGWGGLPGRQAFGRMSHPGSESGERESANVTACPPRPPSTPPTLSLSLSPASLPFITSLAQIARTLLQVQELFSSSSSPSLAAT